ncbi:MAG: carboxypeptidase-like regulatory domain-containing protein [Candidatus Thermoplasmatota archaeon]
MKANLSLFVAIGIVLSGCSGGGEAPTQSFDDLKGTASATTGVLRGLVVDDRIMPVVGAIVDLRGASERPNGTTDDQGRFVFSDLEPGTYFLVVSSPLHKSIQSSAEVMAGEDEPEIVRVQLERLFTQDPFPVQVVREGHFQCSQEGLSVWYSSSTCIDGITGPYVRELYPESSNLTTQNREWHADVGPGWQAIVFEMQWDPTSDGTSQRMGMVVSTYKPERDATHTFAEFEGETPVRGQIDVGVEHETASGVEPTMIPPEGMTNMSFFVGVRSDGFIPGLALNQQFKVYITMFHYGRPPADWSFVAGDPLPF